MGFTTFMTKDIGTETTRPILSGARTPRLLGRSSPNKITADTVANPKATDQPAQDSVLVSQFETTLATAKKVILIKRLHRRMQVSNCEGLVSNCSIAFSLRLLESSCALWVVVSEKRAASLAEKRAESPSITISEPPENDQAIQLTSFTLMFVPTRIRDNSFSLHQQFAIFRKQNRTRLTLESSLQRLRRHTSTTRH